MGEEETAGLQRAKARLAARAAQEEELMARVPLSKGERKNLKAQRRAGLSGGAMLDDFADDVADLIQVLTCDERKCAQYMADSKSVLRRCMLYCAVRHPGSLKDSYVTASNAALDLSPTSEIPLPKARCAVLCATADKVLLLVRPGSACLADPCCTFLQAGDDEGMDPAFLGARKSQKYGVDLSAAAAANVRSGDADLPTKAPLHERRAKFDQVRLVVSLIWAPCYLQRCSPHMMMRVHGCCRRILGSPAYISFQTRGWRR